MAVVLTEIQREAKRKRDAEYRARKKEKEMATAATAQKSTPVAAPTQAVSNLTEKVEDRAQSLREAVFQTKKGKEVESPRGGIQAKVVQKYRDGARLLTSDGRQVRWDTLCQHAGDLPEGYQGTYFEIVGGSKLDGYHGWVHRARGCNRPYQIG